MYVNHSESVRSAEAKQRGVVPASYLAKKLKRYYKSVIAEDVKQALPYTEWHHTSSHYNCTNFYDLKILAEIKYRKKLKQTILDRLNSRESDGEIISGVTYIEWSGSRNYPTKTTYWLEKARITKTGVMAKIESLSKSYYIVGNNKFWTGIKIENPIKKKNYEVNVKKPVYINVERK
jgi:hypothetical protein